MTTSKASSPASSSATSNQVISSKKPMRKPSEKRHETSLEEWHKKARAGLSDQTRPFPKVW
jgi:hypothetical protein